MDNRGRFLEEIAKFTAIEPTKAKKACIVPNV